MVFSWSLVVPGEDLKAFRAKSGGKVTECFRQVYAVVHRRLGGQRCRRSGIQPGQAERRISERTERESEE